MRLWIEHYAASRVKRIVHSFQVVWIPWMFPSLFSAVWLPGLSFSSRSCTVPVSVASEIVLPFSGFLVYRGTFDLLFASLAGTLGCLLGSVVAYYFGLKKGRNLIKNHGKYFLATKKVPVICFTRLSACFLTQFSQSPIKFRYL